MTTTTVAILRNYQTGEAIRPATEDELAASIAASADNGTGAIDVDGVTCYVESFA